MTRVIVNNKTDCPDAIVMLKVAEIIKDGRVSNKGKQYCYLIIFHYNNKRYFISSSLNKKSDKFTVTYEHALIV